MINIIIHIIKKLRNKENSYNDKEASVIEHEQEVKPKDKTDKPEEDSGNKKESKRKRKRSLKKEERHNKRVKKLNTYGYFYIIVSSLLMLYISISLPYSQLFEEELVFKGYFKQFKNINSVLISYEFENLNKENFNFNIKKNDNVYLTFKDDKGILKLKNIYNNLPDDNFFLKAKVREVYDDNVSLNIPFPKHIKNKLSSGTEIDSISSKTEGIIVLKKVLGKYRIIRVE